MHQNHGTFFILLVPIVWTLPHSLFLIFLTWRLYFYWTKPPGECRLTRPLIVNLYFSYPLCIWKVKSVFPVTRPHLNRVKTGPSITFFWNFFFNVIFVKMLPTLPDPFSMLPETHLFLFFGHMTNLSNSSIPYHGRNLNIEVTFVSDFKLPLI